MMRIERFAYELDGKILCANCYFERLENRKKQGVISIINDRDCVITNEKWKAKGFGELMWCDDCNVNILYDLYDEM